MATKPDTPSLATSTEIVSTDDLAPYEGNPRQGNLAAIKESLLAHGQYRPIVANRPTGEVLAGNHTLQAARELGWEEIAVTYVEVDAEQAARIVLVDNRTNDLAGYDDECLAALLGELPDLAGTGYDRDDLDQLLSELGKQKAEEDSPPPPPEDPVTRPGDLIELGTHRLLCADAREQGSYRALLGDGLADLLWTDPPYGVAYEGKTEAKLQIQGDSNGELKGLLEDGFTAANSSIKDGAPIYISHPGGVQSMAFANAFLRTGWSFRQTLIWVKNSIVLGHSDYHYRHEQILYGFKPAPGRLGRGGSGWHGNDAQASVLEFDRPRASLQHPTMKSPALIEHCLRNSSRPGALILDPFAGSGSTLVACEQSGRAARLIELDPGYCDVICNRFEQLSGEKVRRAR